MNGRYNLQFTPVEKAGKMTHLKSTTKNDFSKLIANNCLLKFI